jgi:hypothetical protein
MTMVMASIPTIHSIPLFIAIGSIAAIPMAFMQGGQQG